MFKKIVNCNIQRDQRCSYHQSLIKGAFIRSGSINEANCKNIKEGGIVILN